MLLIGLRLWQRANRLLVSMLIGSGIDLKEQISFVDKVTFSKGDIDNVTADPGGYRHQLDCRRSAGELVPIDHFLLLRFADRDLGGWEGPPRGVVGVAGSSPKAYCGANHWFTAAVRGVVGARGW